MIFPASNSCTRIKRENWLFFFFQMKTPQRLGSFERDHFEGALCEHSCNEIEFLYFFL